jgi:hypothetical protein
LDLAVGQTLLHGGAVVPLPPEQAPFESPVAALLRY